MSHPLLTEVLWKAMVGIHGSPGYAMDKTKELLTAIPPDIADLLEAALDRCATCGLTSTAYRHLGEEYAETAHEDFAGHAFEPLVTP